MAVTITIPTLTLDGWRTYICAGALIGLSVAHSAGYISTNLYDILLPVIGGGGLAALRSAVAKSGPQPIVDQVASLVTEAINLQPPCQTIAEPKKASCPVVEDPNPTAAEKPVPMIVEA